MFKAQGLKAARQKYAYNTAGRTISGENVYSILRGPRADATEAVVLMAAWRNMDNILNQSGVALLLTMARYFNSTRLLHSCLTIYAANMVQDGPYGPRTSSSL